MPPLRLSCWTRIFAAASAGLSNGAICPLLSNAQPITIGALAADALPPMPVRAAAAASVAASANHRLARPIKPLLFFDPVAGIE
jgi:hypothetical protein